MPIGTFGRDLTATLREPAFWGYSSWLDILVKYRRTSIGPVWMVLPPFVFCVLLGTIYSQLMHFPPQHYLPFLGVGYLLWRVIIQVITESTSVLRNHKSFIFDGRVRLTDYFLRTLSKAMFYFIASVPILAGVFAWSDEMHVINLATLLVTMPFFLLGMLWIAAHLALFGARFPDTAEFTNTILIFAFLVTPILWYPQQAHGGHVLSMVTRANPAAHLINFVRDPLLGKMPDHYTLWFVGIFIVVGGLSTSFLYRRYGRYVPLWI